MQRIESQYFNIPGYNGEYPVFRERVYCYELYHQLRCNIPNEFPFTIHGELDKAGNVSIYELLRGKKPDFVVHKPGTSNNLIVMEVKSIKSKLDDIIDDCYKLKNFENNANYTQQIMIIFGSYEKEKDEQLLGNVKLALAENGLLTQNLLLIWHKEPGDIEYWNFEGNFISGEKGNKLKIAVVSDSNSRINGHH